MPGTVGAINSKVQTFDTNLKLARVGSTGGACPVTISTTVTVYSYVVIENSTGLTATVDIFHSQAPNSIYIDTVIAVYAGTVLPDDNNNTARGACVGFQNDTCGDTTNTNPNSCTSSWAGPMKKDSHAS